MSSQTIAGCTLDLSVETLSAWRDRALPEAEAQRVAQHLSTCLACRTRLAEYDAVARALKTLAIPEPFGGYGRNPRLRVEHAGRSTGTRLRFVPPMSLGAVAAVLLIALFAALFNRLTTRPATPTISGTFTYVALDNPQSHPTSIVAGPDGKLWFTESGSSANAIGRITVDGKVTEFRLAVSDAFPTSIITGPDGNLWFAESTADRIGRITPQGTITEYEPPYESHPQGIAVGADGNLWYTAFATDRIGHMSLDGRLLGEYPTPTGAAGPWGIARGADGNLWFTELAADKIGRITPQGVIREFASPYHIDTPIVAGADGNLWFTSPLNGKIGRITPQGQLTFFPETRLSGTLAGMTVGPDGNVWFVLNAPAQSSETPSIGRITPSGVISLIHTPARDILSGLAFGPDSNLWLTVNDSAKIARFSPSG